MASALSTPSNTDPLFYMARYDLDGRTADGELSFYKGDKLEILDKYTYKNWWHAKNIRTALIGYVPENYISPIHDLTIFEWYFTETDRDDAVRFLEQPENGKGTFLIRSSETCRGENSLSVLDLCRERHFHVKHYRIRQTDEGMYYLTSKNLFPTLEDLVEYYQANVYRGLCCSLTYPCRKVEPKFSTDRDGLVELDRSKLIRSALLYKGNLSEVFNGKYGQRSVAIKFIKTNEKNRSCNVEKFIREAEIMKELLHTNIVRLYGVCTEKEPISIVMEYMSHGCLLNYLRERPVNDLTLKLKLDFAVQIAKGMDYLEQKCYVHCNLAARNILVGELDVVKIGNFSRAKIVQGDHLMVDGESRFSIKWKAPEVVTKKEYTTKSDVWSFGILLYELITHGSNPYPEMSDDEALQAILSGYRMEKPNDCLDDYYQIILSCWQENPDNRPTFETLYLRFDELKIQANPDSQCT